MNDPTLLALELWWIRLSEGCYGLNRHIHFGKSPPTFAREFKPNLGRLSSPLYVWPSLIGTYGTPHHLIIASSGPPPPARGSRGSQYFT
jgi:hypothetical protein